MLLAEELLAHARFLSKLDPRATSQANIRRAISAAYYAVFHLLSGAVAEQVSPGFPPGLRERTQRVLGHSQMLNVAKAFSQQGKNKVDCLPKGFVLPAPISQELASVSNGFKDLQEARHTADYDVLKQYNPGDELALVQQAEKIFRDWSTEKSSQNAAVFLAALIFGKDWGR